MKRCDVVWCAVVLCALAGCAMTPKVSVAGPVQTLTFSAGETQSTVVGPGLKSQCPAGRLLVTNDFQRPPQTGTVVGRNLDAQGGADVQSSFDSPPIAAGDLTWGTNDHDISVLANGDVILTFSVHIKAPLSPKPPWFDLTFRNGFGPGVRRGLMTWRSTDCGQTFHFRSTVDPVTLGGGICANPQPVGGSTQVNGAFPPPFYTGGVDGNLVKADVATDKLYLMFQCVGNLPANKPDYELSPSKVNQTYVLRSDDEGQTWTALGNLSIANWRIGVAAVESGKLAFGQSNQLLFAAPAGGGYQFDTSGTPAPNGTPGWAGLDTTVSPLSLINANVWANTLVVRSPDTWSVYLLFPSTIADASNHKSHGYRVFFFDRVGNQWAEAAPILPVKHDTKNLVMHAAAIEVKGAPTLLYWYDVDGDTGTVTMRGRLIYGNQLVTDDFVVARDAGAPPPVHSFQLAGSKHWYGDYHTAGGCAVNSNTWNYYPIWAEPDGTVRFSQVSATQDPNAGPPFSAIAAKQIKASTPKLAPIPLSAQKPRPIEIPEGNEH